MGGLRVRVGVLLGEGREGRGSRHPPDDAHVEPDGGGLVDHDDAVAVGEFEHLLGVGVVRGAERVRADPLHELEVVDHERVVVPLAAHRRVLVLAEPGEVEGLAVDEELVSADFDGAHAHRDRVAVDDLLIRERFDRQLVEVCGARAPEHDVRHGQSAGRARSPRRRRCAGGVRESHPHLGRTRCRRRGSRPIRWRRRSR